MSLRADFARRPALNTRPGVVVGVVGVVGAIPDYRPYARVRAHGVTNRQVLLQPLQPLYPEPRAGRSGIPRGYRALCCEVAT